MRQRIVPSKSLKEILQAQLTTYMTDINPEPVTWSDTFSSLFSTHGRTGRTRAKTYRDTVINVSFNDDELLAQVYRDVSDEDGALGTSKDLRMLLMRGLCHYLGINDTRIDNKERELRRAAIPAMSSSYAPAFPPQYFERMAMLSLLGTVAGDKLQMALKNYQDGPFSANPGLDSNL